MTSALDTMHTTLATLGQKALAGAHPAGCDLRDEADFILLQSEIEKLSNPLKRDAPDWSRIVTLAIALLDSKGKDLLVAAYMTAALLETRGLPGLLDGLQVVRDLLQQYWVPLFPARLRARRSAIDWLIERIRTQTQAWSVPQDPALIDALRAVLLAIDDVLEQKDPEAPSTRTLTPLLAGVPLKAAAPAASIDTATAAPCNVPPDALPNTLHNPPQPQDCDTILLHLRELADDFIDADPTRALAYRLRRIALWGALEALPPVRHAHSLIAAPITPLRDALRQLIASQHPQDLLHFAEAQLPAHPFWLDLNYQAVQAMQRSGAQYDAARAEISSACAALITRWPALIDMTFANAMPFAEHDTKQWLQTLVASNAGVNDRANKRANNSENNSASTQVSAATLDTSGDVHTVAAHAQQLIEQSRVPAQQLQLRIQLCAFLFAERPAADLQALAHIIVNTIDRHQLDAWDPALALSALQAAYLVLRPHDAVTAAAVLTRIAALNAAAALQLLL